MITLEQAIELATEAHKDQWRKSENLDNETSILFMQMEEELYPSILSNGNKVFIKEETFVMKKPYITHPLAVMGMMDTEEEKVVAVFHDVFEQCHNYALGRIMDNSRFYVKNRNSMEEFTISQTVYDALVTLSKYPSDTYEQYIKELSKNKLAIKVKIADMMHNMSESNNPKQKEKYLKALPILLKAL